MVNRDNKQIPMSGDNGFCEERQNRVMGIKGDIGRKPLLLYVLMRWPGRSPKEMNVLENQGERKERAIQTSVW